MRKSFHDTVASQRDVLFVIDISNTPFDHIGHDTEHFAHRHLLLGLIFLISNVG